MHPYVRALSSLKLTVVLILMIAFLLSLGTILESLRGAEAGRAVYYSPFFFGLQALFALNILAALWERWPRNRWRVGFLLTHASVLLILAGALTTAALSVEGRLPLWEGESADSFLRGAEGGRPTAQRLPFSLRLDAFEMDLYPGTRQPAMFRSRVTVRDPSGPERAAVIEMNRPLSYRGYQLFQSSYQIQGGREMSVLSVSKDPGQPIVFLGYGLLVLGMIVVLATRIAQRRETARAALIAIGLLAAGVAARGAAAAESPSAAETQKIRRLPVQSDGRVMPLDTQARDAVRTVTGKEAWAGIDPAAMVIGWTVDPRSWMDRPIVRVDAATASLAGLPAGTGYAGYRALLTSDRLRQALSLAHRREEAGQKPSRADKRLLKVEERLSVLDSYLNGEAVRPVPEPDPRAAWRPAVNAVSAAAYAELEASIRPAAPPYYPSTGAIDREIRYNAVHPTRIAWLLLLPAAIAAGLTLGRDRWRLAWVAGIGTGLGFLVMTWGIWTRWQIAGRIPASNMYESMLFLGWGVGLFGVVSLLLRNRMLVFNASAMSALVMLLLDRLPIDPFIHPMAPVLSGTPWLAIHVPIIMVSYSVFAIATFLAHVVVGVGIFAPARRDLGERWSDLLYWYLVVGSILLIAGILTGSIWAASSWGRYWGWDPKEVWSLVAFLAYMAILHARLDGQIGSFGVAVSSIVAFWTILMTYLGVNFVLASGLHSYGFGSSNLVRVMGVIAMLEIAFLLAGWQAERKRRPAPRRRAAA
jgi:ABC-type transport system involved in cytochrome c biogenesis permease subunit